VASDPKALTELLPCPFCGYAECEVFTDDDAKDPGPWYYGECPNCGARGPWTLTGKAHAADLWNGRACR
jgi:Lar family restriction alleviation protein